MWDQSQNININILVWRGLIAKFNQEFVAVLEKNDNFTKGCPKGVQLWYRYNIEVNGSESSFQSLPVVQSIILYFITVYLQIFVHVFDSLIGCFYLSVIKVFQ